MVGGKYAGRAVHEAARIGSLANGDGIVASRETAVSVRGLRTTDTRSLALKGLAEPIDVVTVPWQSGG